MRCAFDMFNIVQENVHITMTTTPYHRLHLCNAYYVKYYQLLLENI